MAGEKKALTAEEKEQALTDAALDASETLVVHVETVNESELDTFDFMEDLEEIVNVLDVPIQILSFENPENKLKPIRYAMRQLTAEEHAEIFQTLFDPEVMRTVFKEAVDAESEKRKEDAIEKMVQSVQEGDVAARQKEREVAAVYKCMLHPKKKTKKGIEKLPKNMRKSLFKACMIDVERVWLFR